MPVVNKQHPKVSTAKTGPKSVLNRIGPLAYGDDGIKINIYGASGSGKTTFWSSFPKKILAIVCSGGNKPGELRSINTPELRKSIDQVVLHKSSELLEITQYIQQNPKTYATVVLDHASGLQDLILREELELEEIPVQKSWGLATREQWGAIGVRIKEYLRALLNLQQHVVIVAQERAFNIEEDNASMLMPYVASALSPSVVGWLNPACDYICQTFKRQRMAKKQIKIGGKVQETLVKVGGVDYCLRVAPHETFTTKFRIPKGRTLPEDIVDPDFTKLLKLIVGS